MRLFYDPDSDTYFYATDCFDPNFHDVTDEPPHVAQAAFDGVVPPAPLFKPFPQRRYSLILGDCPWNYITYSGSGVPARTQEQPYETIPLEALMELPVSSIAEPDSALVLWYLGSHLKQCIILAEHWGFEFKTDLLTWVKVGQRDPKVRPISMGHWSRKQTEAALLFTRGAPERLDASVRQLIEAEDHVIYAPTRKPHSRKPDEQYDRLDRLIGGPKIELFARQPWPGWDGWGNEYDPHGGL